MEVVARSLGHENQFLPHVAVDAGLLAGFQELHVGLDAHFARVHLMMDEVLDQAVGAVLPRHILGMDDVEFRFIRLAERLRGLHVVGAERRGLFPGQ